MSRAKYWLLAAPAVALLALAGCNPSGKVVVEGTLVKGGTPVTIPEEEYDEEYNTWEVKLTPVDDAGNEITDRSEYSTTVNADGTFTFYGDLGDGIEPGKYKVSAAKLVENPDPDEEEDDPTLDEMKGKYGKEVSKLIVDVDGSDLTIDLDQITGGGA